MEVQSQASFVLVVPILILYLATVRKASTVT